MQNYFKHQTSQYRPNLRHFHNAPVNVPTKKERAATIRAQTPLKDILGRGNAQQVAVFEREFVALHPTQELAQVRSHSFKKLSIGVVLLLLGVGLITMAQAYTHPAAVFHFKNSAIARMELHRGPQNIGPVLSIYTDSWDSVAPVQRALSRVHDDCGVRGYVHRYDRGHDDIHANAASFDEAHFHVMLPRLAVNTGRSAKCVASGMRGIIPDDPAMLDKLQKEATLLGDA